MVNQGFKYNIKHAKLNVCKVIEFAFLLSFISAYLVFILISFGCYYKEFENKVL